MLCGLLFMLTKRKELEMDVKWIKICTDIFDDEKILLIESMPDADSLIVIWFKLLCLAGKQNNNGIFVMNDKIPYTDEMLAIVMRRPINTVRLAIKTFELYGMVEVIDNVITIPSWNKHQSLDKLNSCLEQNRARQARYREKLKNSVQDNDDTKSNVTGNVTVTLRNATDKIRIDRDIDIINNNICDTALAVVDNTPPLRTPKGGRKTKFVKPTLEEVKDYCKQRKNNVDSQKWYDYYESNGWKVGRNSMKDWKASIRLWERNGYSAPSGAKPKNDFKYYDYSVSPFEEYENFFSTEKSTGSGDKNDK